MRAYKMKEERRIERILHKIGLIWMRVPQERFFQLLFNYTQLGTRDEIGTVRDPFYYEDDDLEKQLDEMIKEFYRGKK